MSATIKCKAELQTEIVERVISELIAVLEPLDLDLEWDEEDPLSAFVKELVLVTEKGIKVESLAIVESMDDNSLTFRK